MQSAAFKAIKRAVEIFHFFARENFAAYRLELCNSLITYCKHFEFTLVTLLRIKEICLKIVSYSSARQVQGFSKGLDSLLAFVRKVNDIDAISEHESGVVFCSECSARLYGRSLTAVFLLRS